MSITTLSPAVAKPDHVPESLVYDFDFFADPGVQQNAHNRALEIVKDAPPIFWTPRQGGHWVLKSHNAVFEGQRQVEVFSNSPMPYEQIMAINASLPADKKMFIPAPITFDPPHHAVYRGPLQSAFSPKAMAALKDDIRELAAELIEGIKADGQCEFMMAVAEPLPVTIFLRIFGLPEARQREYRDLVKEHFAATERDSQAIQIRLRKVADIMKETILERKENPQNDVISLLWKSEFNGKPATLEDLENYCVMLFTAGLDTVMNGIGLGIAHLANDLPMQARLRNNPEEVSSATEELLRRYTFTLPPRFVAQDTEFQGVQLRKGEMALVFLPGADLDPAVFNHPEEFKIDRENKTHIAFGAGPHRCLGSHLARLELNILYEEMLARLPEFRIDPERATTYHGGFVWGPEELYLVW
jgi:cytochrome P450